MRERIQLFLLRDSLFFCFQLTQVFHSSLRQSDTLEMPDGDADFAQVSKIWKEKFRRKTRLSDSVRQLRAGPFFRLKPTETKYALLKAFMLYHCVTSKMSDEGSRLVCSAKSEFAGALLAHCRQALGDTTGVLRCA